MSPMACCKAPRCPMPPMCWKSWCPRAIRRMSPVLPISAATTSSSPRSEEHTSELQSLMRISYAVFCLKKKKKTKQTAYIKLCVHTQHCNKIHKTIKQHIQIQHNYHNLYIQVEKT